MKVYVEIGMPVWNCAETVEAAICSVMDQSYQNWVLNISDNHSADGTLEICKKFAKKDSRISVSSHDSNIGGWNNFDFVIRKSNFTLFKFLAGDDVISPDFLHEAVELLQANPNAIGVAPLDYWDWEYASNMAPQNFTLSGMQYERLRSLRNNCWRSQGMFYGLYRTELYKKAASSEIFTSRIQICDWLILSRLAMFGEILRTERAFSVLGSSGASNSKDATWWTQLAGAKRKLFPYVGFYTLSNRVQTPIDFQTKLGLLRWLLELQWNHSKGIILMLLKYLHLKK